MPMFKFESPALSDIHTAEADVEAAEVALNEAGPKGDEDLVLALRVARLDLQTAQNRYETLYKQWLKAQNRR